MDSKDFKIELYKGGCKYALKLLTHINPSGGFTQYTVFSEVRGDYAIDLGSTVNNIDTVSDDKSKGALLRVLKYAREYNESSDAGISTKNRRSVAIREASEILEEKFGL